MRGDAAHTPCYLIEAAATVSLRATWSTRALLAALGHDFAADGSPSVDAGSASPTLH